MPDSSDLDYNPNNKNDIDDRRKKCTKRKKRNAGGRNAGPKLTIYQCSLCSYRTGLRTILKRHFAVCFAKPEALRHQSKAVNLANVRATFRCEFCCFATTTGFMLMKHKSTHFSRIRNGLVECSHCDLTFFTMAECKKHMNEQSDLYETKSIQENMSPSAHVIPNNSSNSIEVNRSLYSCWCGVFQTASRSQYLHHLKRIHSINFDIFEELNENEKTENGQATEELGCPMPDCSFQTYNEDDLELHLTQHHELDYDHIEIGVVRDETTQSKTLKPHEPIETTDQQSSALSDIEMLEDLQKQVKFIEVYAANDEDDSDLTETDDAIEKSESFICEWCAYETTDNLHLDFHNRLVHNSNNVYICPQTDCLFQSENQSSFKVHVLVTHQFSDIVKSPVNGSLIAHQLNGIQTGPSHQINIHPEAAEDDQQDTNIDTDETETIRIEVVEDQTDNTTAEDSLENYVKKSSLLIKCLNKGCDYYSRYDSDSIRNHINICSKKHESDNNLIPRESSNVPIYNDRTTINIGPPLCDANLPVFGCTECNFKTNEIEMLDHHKSLHWNAEKDAAYAAKQWFTCEICFYYCFDAGRFKQHEEIHRKASSFH